MKSQDYKETMEQVHAPSALLERLENMNGEQKLELKKVLQHKRRKRVARLTASVAAAFVLCMLASNAICYAAIGNTWIQVITMYINGEPIEGSIHWNKSGDSMVGEMKIEDENGENTYNFTYIIEDNGQSGKISIDTPPEVEIKVQDGVTEISVEEKYEENKLVQDGDMIYLSLGFNCVRLDITEDIADGSASGTFEYGGKTYSYQVEGNVEAYHISTDFMVEE